MLDTRFHRQRRQLLAKTVEGPILLLGLSHRCRNLPMNHLPFRQDSTFLYYSGCTTPGAAMLIDDSGSTLFLPDIPPSDALWHGETRSPQAEGERLGFDRVRSADALSAAIRDRTVKTLSVPDPARNALGHALTGVPLKYGSAHGSPDLVRAVVEQRRCKAAEELDELRAAAAATDAAHRAVISSTHEGTHERELAALFRAVLAARGCVTGYDTILTKHGEILHNHSHTSTLSAGDLLLLDGGAERPSGYGADVTRTWPVSGRFTPRQAAAYDAVLASQERAIELCVPGTPYREVHLEACRVLARWLADEGLLRCSVDESIASGAHAIFFPHGIGHLLGLDVHDLENFGDLPAYTRGKERSTQFGLAYLRLDLPLEPGWVVTIEPGFYVVPSILEERGLRERLGDRVNWDLAARWLGFGGIRIEDDVLVTSSAPEVLTSRTPKTRRHLEELVGSGPTVRERLQ